jgi:hypothetical protein
MSNAIGRSRVNFNLEEIETLCQTSEGVSWNPIFSIQLSQPLLRTTETATLANSGRS